MPTPAMSSTSSERRRQWLISHGLLSPSSGPSRRLGSLLPRVGPRSSARSAEVDVCLDATATPVLVTRASQERPTAPRAVSMPSAEARAERGPPPVARAASTRVGHGDRPASPPRRRFFRRRGRNKRLDDERNKSDGRQVIRVVDRQLPRHVLNTPADDVTFDGTKWNEYRQRIDGLKQDPGFIDYLTEGVADRRSDVNRQAIHETQQLAVNKLYPLAFIRLLEAQAKFQDDDEEQEQDPDEEKHRYDDPDRDDEAKVVRTASSGIYDMGRFRTVGGNRMEGRRSESTELAQLLEDSQTDRRVDRGIFHGSMGRNNRAASVPVY